MTFTLGRGTRTIEVEVRWLKSPDPLEEQHRLLEELGRRYGIATMSVLKNLGRTLESSKIKEKVESGTCERTTYIGGIV